MPQLRQSWAERLFQLVPNNVLNGLNVHSASGEYAKHMYSEQFAYGDREIILKYSGLPYSTQLIGNLQHGTFLPDEPIDFGVPRFQWGRPAKFWVYSREVESQARSLGLTHVHAIGAPWLYLQKATSSMPVLREGSMPKILILPGHSQTNYWNMNSRSEKMQRARLFRQAVGSRDATICLHAVDFCDPDIRNSFLEMNFPVTCVGSSQSVTPWTQASNRVRMLFDLMELMRTHSHFITDDFGTSIFYAISMGLEIAIFPEISAELKYQWSSENSETTSDGHLQYFQQNLQKSINQFAPAHNYSELADSVLGRESLRSPQELREVLDYKVGVYPDFSAEPW